MNNDEVPDTRDTTKEPTFPPTLTPQPIQTMEQPPVSTPTPESQSTPAAAPQLNPADFESPFAGAMFSAASNDRTTPLTPETQPTLEPLPITIPEPIPTSPLGTPVPEVPSPSIEPVPRAKPGLFSKFIGMFRQK